MSAAPRIRCEALTATGSQCQLHARFVRKNGEGRNVCGLHVKAATRGFIERVKPSLPHKPPSRVVAPRGTIDRVMRCATSQLSESLKRHASAALLEINGLGVAFNETAETPAQGVVRLEALIKRCHGISDRLRLSATLVAVDLEVLAHAAALGESEAGP